LLIELAAPLALALPRLGAATLPRMTLPPRYAYGGSAYGPGGLRARIRRHLRAEKPLRWHVDRLIAAGRVVGRAGRPWRARVRLGARPARASRDLGAHPRLRQSSDCRACPAHLVALPVGSEPAILGV